MNVWRCVNSYPPHAPVPMICPTTYDLVSIEWSLPGAEVSLEIIPETYQGELVWAASHSADSGEITVNMAEPEDWAGWPTAWRNSLERVNV